MIKLLLNNSCNARIITRQVSVRDGNKILLYCLLIDKGDYDTGKNYKVRDVIREIKVFLGGHQITIIDEKQYLVYWMSPTKRALESTKSLPTPDEETEEMAKERFVNFLTGKSRGRVSPDSTLNVQVVL